MKVIAPMYGHAPDTCACRQCMQMCAERIVLHAAEAVPTSMRMGALQTPVTARKAASEIRVAPACCVSSAQAYVRLTKQFRELYLQRTGLDVRFRLTFAGSGVQVGDKARRGGALL